MEPTERVCKECGLTKATGEFSGRWIPGKRIEWRWKGAHYCRACMRVRASAHYHTAKNQQNLNVRKIFNKTMIYDYLKEHPCVDCGERNPVVLEFDHVRGEKKFNISAGMVKGYTWSILADEIAKCDIRCANCHRIKTAKQFDWLIYQMYAEENH